MTDSLSINRDIAVVNTSKGLQQPSSPIVDMLESNICLQWLDFCLNKVYVFWLDALVGEELEFTQR